MKPVDRAELLDLAAYEPIREPFRARVIADKRVRRVALGPNMSVLFENHDTVLLQIQEMLRTERISAEKAVQHELDTYNQLIAAADELSATVFIEYEDREQRDRMLVALAGVEGSFYLEVDGQRAAARNETGATATDRTTAVHYMKFPLGASQAGAVRGGSAIALGVAHAAYSAHVVLGAATLDALRDDLL